MRRIDRYVLREVIPPFLLGTIVVLALFQVPEFINLRNSLAGQPARTQDILKLLLFQTPGILNFTLPISVCLASAIAMARITRESELTALRSAGTRIARVVFPMSLFGLLIGVSNFLLIDYVSPLASREGYRLRNQQLGGPRIDDFASNVSIKVGDQLISIGTAKRGKNDQVSFQDILIISDSDQSGTLLTTAKEGIYSDGKWRFPKTQEWRFPTGSGSPTYRQVTNHEIREVISVQDLFTPPEPDKLTSSALRTRIEERRRMSQDTRALEIEYQIKFSVPVMCWIFSLISPIFAILFARQGGFIGVLVSLTLVLAYYNICVISTQILTKITDITPFAAAWVPNLIFLAIGLMGLRALE